MGESMMPPPNRTGAPMTMVEVVHKFVSDLPHYVLLGIVGVMALKGQASAVELILGGSSAYLAKSWPKPVQMGVPLLVAASLATVHLSACGASAPSPAQQAIVAAYESEQLECVATRQTRADIDSCRLAVKAKYGRAEGGK